MFWVDFLVERRNFNSVVKHCNVLLVVVIVIFSVRCNIYISHLCYDVSVRLSVMEVH